MAISALDKFNMNLNMLINTIQSRFDSLKPAIEAEYILPIEGDKYLNGFWKRCKTIGDDLSAKSEIIFSKDSIVLPGIDFFELWNDESLTDPERDMIWQYLHALYLFAFEHKRQGSFETVIELFNTNRLDLEKIDNETKTFINILDRMTKQYENPEVEVKLEGEEEETEGESMFNLPELMDSNIGVLAKEIASELDPSTLDIKLDNPAEVLKNLMSGKLDEGKDGGLINLIKTITDKVQKKVESKGLDEKTLFDEAQKLMGKLGKKGKNLGANMFKQMAQTDLFKGMSEEEKAAVNEAFSAMTSNPSAVKKSVELKSTRDRLKKKLEERRAAKNKET